MAAVGKILGSAKPAAATLTTLFTVGSGKEATFSIFAANQGAATGKVRIAIGDANPPGAAEYVVYDDPLAAAGSAGGSKSYGPFAVQAAKLIVVRADTADVSFVASGFEDSVL